MTGGPVVLVTGAGGFIGHHLTRFLVARGYRVRGVDVKAPEFEPTRAHEFALLDLRERENCLEATRNVHEVYNLAANMGGIGFIEAFKAKIVHDNVLINTHMLESSRINGVRRFLFTSSACVYPAYRQDRADVSGLREEDAYPADSEDGYGWEKLFTERLCRHYREDYGLETRVARLHNVYGPLGTYDGGREKAPAALCRKIARAGDDDTIEVWGDGRQTRSFCFVDDCVDGLHRLMRSDCPDPLNIGSDRLISINELVHLVMAIAGKRIRVRHDPGGAQGVRGRNSDNTRLRAALDWEPSTSLEEGIARTYRWIHSQVRSGAADGVASTT